MIRFTLTACTLLLVQTVAAQVSTSFPGNGPDKRTMETQIQVERLFEAGEYARAMFIYKNELAPIGDKYAQYNIGYMYLTGTVVEEDPAVASAWYRLAAEREKSPLREVSDELYESLSPQQQGRSDELYRQLLREYSDAVILLELIRDDISQLTARTGSRAPGGGGSIAIFDPRSGSGESGDAFYRRLRQRIESRLEFLAETVGDPSLVEDVNSLRIDALENSVKRYIDSAGR